MTKKIDDKTSAKPKEEKPTPKTTEEKVVAKKETSKKEDSKNKEEKRIAESKAEDKARVKAENKKFEELGKIGRGKLEPIQITRIQDVVINGKDHKKISLINGTTQILSEDELKQILI